MRLKRSLNDWNGTTWVARAAHENVDRGKIPLWPSMDRDMTLCQHNHPGYATIRREVMEVTVKDCRPRRDGRFPKRPIDMIRLIEVARTPEINEKMRAGKSHAVPLHEIVQPLFPFDDGNRVNLSLAIAREFRDHPQLSKCVHHVPPNQQMTCWAFAPLGREA